MLPRMRFKAGGEVEKWRYGGLDDVTYMQHLQGMQLTAFGAYE